MLLEKGFAFEQYVSQENKSYVLYTFVGHIRHKEVLP